MNKRKQRDHNGNQLPGAKRVQKQTIRYGDTEKKNYNDLFPNSEDETNEMPGTSAEKTHEISVSPRNHSADFDCFSLINSMSVRIKYLTTTMNGLSKQVQELQNKAVLRIDETVREEEIPLLNKFNSFKLPIEDRVRLEELNADLKSDQSFNIFFVSVTHQKTLFICLKCSKNHHIAQLS